MPNNKHSIEYLLIFRLGGNWFLFSKKNVECRNLMMINRVTTV